VRIVQVNSLLTGGGTDDQVIKLAGSLHQLGQPCWIAGPEGRECSKAIRERGLSLYAMPPAASAGLTAGSVITAVNGQAIGAPDSLTGMVSKFKPGTTIKVTWVSPSGQRSTSSIKLTAGPPQ